MPRRIDIELTSHGADGTWTWRTAGAKQPRGVVDAALVPEGLKVGDVVRAEIESGIEGVDVVSLQPITAEPTRPAEPTRIEVLGTPKMAPGVTTVLAPGSRRRMDDDRGPRREGRRDGAGPRDGPGPRRGPAGRSAGGPRRDGERTERAEAWAGTDSPGRDRAPGRREPGRRSDGPPDRGDAARRDRRPTTSTAHRNAALADLGPEQLPIAEQLLRGGMPAVRQAIEEQQARARAEEQPPVAVDAIVKIAEDLLPTIKLAEWKDRASSAQSGGRETRLRDLRAVVSGSRTVTLDEEGRAMAKALKENLEHRVTALRDEWVGRITKALEVGQVLDAVRTSTRPPEPGTRCPAELAVSLAEAAGAAMTAETDPVQWLALLEAVVDSPVRRSVHPVGVPIYEETRAAALQAAGLVPELAKLLGLRIPPPPPRRVVTRRTLSPAGGGGSTAAP